MLTYKILNYRETREQIALDDDFMQSLNPKMYEFLQIEDPSLEKYKEVCYRSARNFKTHEKEFINHQMGIIQKRWLEMNLPPLEVYIARTNGTEMRSLCYTRGKTIFLNSKWVLSNSLATGSLMAHELFHVFSRQNPEIKSKAYKFFGFKKVDEIFPEDRVLNPDCVINNYAIEAYVGLSFKKTWVVPYISSIKGSFSYRVFDLTSRTSHSIWKTSLPWSIGITTQYIAHAEEICADFFCSGLMGVRRLMLYNPLKVKSFMKALTAPEPLQVREPVQFSSPKPVLRMDD